MSGVVEISLGSLLKNYQGTVSGLGCFLVIPKVRRCGL